MKNSLREQFIQKAGVRPSVKTDTGLSAGSVTDQELQKVAQTLRSKIEQAVESGDRKNSPLSIHLDDAVDAVQLSRNVDTTLDGIKAIQKICSARDVDMKMEFKMTEYGTAVLQVTLDQRYRESPAAWKAPLPRDGKRHALKLPNQFKTPHIPTNK